MSGAEPERSLQARTKAFLHEFFARGQELVRELIEDNERLRARLDASEPATSALVPDLVTQLMRQLERLESECQEIRRLAGTLERQSGHYRDRLEGLEREHYQLAAMYVAGNQFHGATTIDEVMRTITEILLNFVGIGRFTVYAIDEERQVLFPLHREGGAFDPDEDCEIGLPAAGPLGEALRGVGPWRGGRPDGRAAGTIMHLPLVSGTRVVGVARLEGFLPQKHSLEAGDVGLLELISEQAGIGIESAWIRAHAKDTPFARARFEELVVA